MIEIAQGLFVMHTSPFHALVNDSIFNLPGYPQHIHLQVTICIPKALTPFYVNLIS